MNVNKVLLVGRVTAEPQLRTTPSGTSVATFSLATNRVWAGKEGKKEETEFHNIVAWGRTAEIASQFLQKGAMAFIEGRIQTRSWQDKQGQARKTTEIICENLQLGPRAAGGGSSAPKAAKPAGEPEAAPAEEIPVIDLEDDIKPEDLPF
jgi:single-strand DNA-binding protein